jgi:hypothetical protein
MKNPELMTLNWRELLKKILNYTCSINRLGLTSTFTIHNVRCVPISKISEQQKFILPIDFC